MESTNRDIKSIKKVFKSYVNMNENFDIRVKCTEDDIISDTLDSDNKEVEDPQIESCT